jgi:hypothetical protein
VISESPRDGRGGRGLYRATVEGDPGRAADQRDSLIDAAPAALGHDEVVAVTGHQAADDRRRQYVATPEPVAAD